MAAIHSNKMMTCRRRPDQLSRQPSNLSNYEGYHGDETASVPFRWESQPGTPKLNFRETSLPRLTPPPSYSYTAYSTDPNHTRSNVKAHDKKNSSSTTKSNILQFILPKRVARKLRVPPPPPLASASCSPPLSVSSSSSSSSYKSWQRSRSVPSTPTRCPRKEKEDEEDLYDVPVSGTCFGNTGFRGCYSSTIKKVMLGDFL